MRRVRSDYALVFSQLALRTSDNPAGSSNTLGTAIDRAHSQGITMRINKLCFAMLAAAAMAAGSSLAQQANPLDTVPDNMP